MLEKCRLKSTTITSQGSIIPNEPGKNSPDERSWKARLRQYKNNPNYNVLNQECLLMKEPAA